jgi:hypothetical protein
MNIRTSHRKEKRVLQLTGVNRENQAPSGNGKIPGARTEGRQKGKTPSEDSGRNPTEKRIIDAFRRNDTDRFS